MNTTLIKYAVIMALCFSCGFGTAWKWQATNITQLKLEESNADTARAKESFRQLELDSAKKSTAQANKVRRDVVIRADVDRAADAGNGLRIASADTARSAQESAAACFRSIGVYDEILGEMDKEGEWLAREADELASKAIEQHEAAR